MPKQDHLDHPALMVPQAPKVQPDPRAVMVNLDALVHRVNLDPRVQLVKE